LIRSRLERLPERLQGRAGWEATLIVAEEHWNSYRAGPAVMAAWEAVIERLGAAYGVDVENYSKQKALGDLATTWNGWRQGEKKLKRFSEKASTLKDYRNAIAHTRQGKKLQPNRVYQDFPDLLEYFQSALPVRALDRLPEAVALDAFRRE
jgi:hypothetical protein